MNSMIDSIVKAVGAEGVLAHLLGIGSIVVGTFLFAWLVRGIIVGIVLRVTRKTKTDLDDQILAAAKPVIMRLVYLSGLAVLNQYLDGRYDWYAPSHAAILGEIIYCLVTLTIILFGLKVIGVLTTWYSREISARTNTKFDDELLPLIRRVAQITVGIIGAITILNHFNIDVKGLLAVLGVGSLAIAFAAQETISNMIAGFVIMIDRPIRVGDRVILRDGMKCDVYEIGVRSTKFLTFDHTIVIVPNAELVKMTINNLSYPESPIRVKLVFQVAYDTNIEQAQELLLEIARANSRLMTVPAPAVFFTAIGDSALELTLIARAENPADQFSAEVEIRTAVLKQFRERGIEIPYPNRTVILRRTDNAVTFQ